MIFRYLLLLIVIVVMGFGIIYSPGFFSTLNPQLAGSKVSEELNYGKISLSKGKFFASFAKKLAIFTGKKTGYWAKITQL